VDDFVRKFNLFWLLIFCVAINAWSVSEDSGIGNEIIRPLQYPKFSLTGDYTTGRWYRDFADPSLRFRVGNRFGAGLSFEAGILKHLNAGALFTASFSQILYNDAPNEPIDLRLGLFAKPYLSLSDRYSLFVRVAAGLTLPFQGNQISYLDTASPSFKSDYRRVYMGQQYDGMPFGGFGAATVGMDFFPFSRLGLSVEWGIRADALHIGRKSPSGNKGPADVPGAPQSFNYLMYEMPLSLTLHVIL
jgi:hypothetical protein